MRASQDKFTTLEYRGEKTSSDIMNGIDLEIGIALGGNVAYSGEKEAGEKNSTPQRRFPISASSKGNNFLLCGRWCPCPCLQQQERSNTFQKQSLSEEDRGRKILEQERLRSEGEGEKWRSKKDFFIISWHRVFLKKNFWGIRRKWTHNFLCCDTLPFVVVGFVSFIHCMQMDLIKGEEEAELTLGTHYFLQTGSRCLTLLRNLLLLLLCSPPRDQFLLSFFACILYVPTCMHHLRPYVTLCLQAGKIFFFSHHLFVFLIFLKKIRLSFGNQIEERQAWRDDHLRL